MNSVLRVNNVSKKAKDFQILNKVSFELGSGEITGLIGPNGAGKTSIMKILVGLTRNYTGEVDLSGVRDIGCMIETPNFYPYNTGYQNLMYFAGLNGVGKKKVKELLELLGLTDAANKNVRTYSLGMRQRLGIAQALLNDPEIVVLDEPTSGLDPKERIRFRNIISAMSKGRIVILSTHIVSDVEFIADEILLMKEGHIEKQGSVDTVTESIRGKVWEYEAKQEEALRLNDRFPVSNLKNQGDRVHLRIVSDICPCEGAMSVSPGLEDVYLYYFEEVPEHVEHMETGNL